METTAQTHIAEGLEGLFLQTYLTISTTRQYNTLTIAFTHLSLQGYLKLYLHYTLIACIFFLL